jgi:hypothetical protein
MMLLAMSSAAMAHAAPRGEVMLLGTYHLANNNRDLVNLPIEDILTEKRQQEIERLVDGLARWHPTHVAVEWPHDDQAGLDRRYADYLAGRLKPTANERDQIAFRLAKKLHLQRVAAIDWLNEDPGNPSDYDFMDWAQHHGQADRLEDFIKEGQDEANRTASNMRGQTISQWYRALNDPKARLKDHQQYFTIASFGSNDRNPGAAWVGAWYARNLRIFNNLRDLIGPGERLFVLYGAGHTYLLSRFIDESNAAVLIDPRKFIPRR